MLNSKHLLVWNKTTYFWVLKMLKLRKFIKDPQHLSYKIIQKSVFKTNACLDRS